MREDDVTFLFFFFFVFEKNLLATHSPDRPWRSELCKVTNGACVVGSFMSDLAGWMMSPSPVLVAMYASVKPAALCCRATASAFSKHKYSTVRAFSQALR
jgi:hypothetical protein